MRNIFLQFLQGSLLLGSLLLACVPWLTYAQPTKTPTNTGNVVTTEQQVPEEIIQAFEAGNSILLAQYLANRVTMSVEGKLNTFTRKQVQAYFKKFFSTAPPTRFERVHQGAAQNDILYYIARYSSLDKVYRIYLHLKGRDGKYLIQSISVDASD